jgi:hypothetical protein
LRPATANSIYVTLVQSKLKKTTIFLKRALSPSSIAAGEANSMPCILHISRIQSDQKNYEKRYPLSTLDCSLFFVWGSRCDVVAVVVVTTPIHPHQLFSCSTVLSAESSKNTFVALQNDLPTLSKEALAH